MNINIQHRLDTELVDIGDYDNDGMFEYVFRIGTYNQDGYLLLYNNFTKTSFFSWKYH